MNMKTRKKTCITAAALLFCALLLPIFTACSGSVGRAEETTGTVSATDETQSETANETPTEAPSSAGTPTKETSPTPTGTPIEDPPFTVYALSLGKADCFIIKTENGLVVVDLGVKSKADEIVEKVASFGDEVDALLITHYDKDHIGALRKFLKNFPLQSAYLPAYEDEKPENAAEVKGYLTNYEVKTTVVTEQVSFELDGAVFTVLPTSLDFGGSTTASNASSLAMLVTYGEKSFLFTGDAEGQRLTEILSQLPDPSAVDWLKAPHHGNYDGKAEDFFDALSPSYAVITCSKDEPADGSIVRALQDAGAKVWLTVNGNVRTDCDGSTITVKYD